MTPTLTPLSSILRDLAESIRLSEARRVDEVNEIARGRAAATRRVDDVKAKIKQALDSLHNFREPSLTSQISGLQTELLEAETSLSLELKKPQPQPRGEPPVERDITALLALADKCEQLGWQAVCVKDWVDLRDMVDVGIQGAADGRPNAWSLRVLGCDEFKGQVDIREDRVLSSHLMKVPEPLNWLETIGQVPSPTVSDGCPSSQDFAKRSKVRAWFQVWSNTLIVPHTDPLPPDYKEMSSVHCSVDGMGRREKHRVNHWADLYLPLLRRHGAMDTHELFRQELEETSGVIDCGCGRNPKHVLSWFVQDAVHEATEPRHQSPYTLETRRRASGEVLTDIQPYLNALKAAPWSDQVSGPIAKVKLLLEGGRGEFRYWDLEHRGYFGMRVRTLDHTWIRCRIFLLDQLMIDSSADSASEDPRSAESVSEIEVGVVTRYEVRNLTTTGFQWVRCGGIVMQLFDEEG